jgi:hypothetical protein
MPQLSGNWVDEPDRGYACCIPRRTYLRCCPGVEAGLEPRAKTESCRVVYSNDYLFMELRVYWKRVLVTDFQ